MMKKILVTTLAAALCLSACQAGSMPAVQMPGADVVGTATTLTWADAQRLITGGEALTVTQVDAQHISIDLKDGRTVMVTVPTLDEVRALIAQCGDLCKDLRVTLQ